MKKIAVTAWILAAFLAGCQQPGESGAKKQDRTATQQITQEKNSIAELKQTTKDTALRDQAYEKVLKSDILTGGYMGENTAELQEDMGVDMIEAAAAFEAVNQVYGNFYDHGIFYLKDQTSGADEPGVWIGIKNPDQKSDKLIEMLQKQVDEGEILAKYIHIFKSEYSEKDNQVLADKVSKAVRKAAESHPEPDRVFFSVSVDTITQTIEIGHDFLTDTQIKKLQQQFSSYEMGIKQEGRMLPLPGEPDVEHKGKEVTRTPSKNGSYVMSISKDTMLVVNAEPADYGSGDHYGAVHYTFPNASEKLKVGQRVVVESSGPIMESYPGQGRAKFVTILPTYQPEKAALTEEEAVRQAIGKNPDGGGWAPVSEVAFHEQTGQWTVTFALEQKKVPVIIEDKQTSE